jgi:serine/threonine protein phosphatase PrpC
MSNDPQETQFVMPSLIELDLAIMSRQGGRSYNEDACGHWNSDHHLCCVVADGAGGHGGGDIASKLAVQYLLQRCAEQPVVGPARVHEMLQQANRYIISQRLAGSPQENMHSTVVSLFIDLDNQTALWGHVGDSRLYVFRRGQLRTQTRDHSLVQSLLDAGLIRADQMRSHEKRSELLCALGSDESDLHIGVSPDAWLIAPGDVFLLCTDGVWEYVDEDDLERTLRTAADPRDWLTTLEALVLKNALHKPRHDNFSALTVWANESA